MGKAATQLVSGTLSKKQLRQKQEVCKLPEAYRLVSGGFFFFFLRQWPELKPPNHTPAEEGI